jgi:DNA polymerase eta
VLALFNLPCADIHFAKAFLDFTEPIRQHILAHFPNLATPPPEGLDTPLPPPPREGVPLAYPPSRVAREDEKGNIWADLGTMVPISGKPIGTLASKEANTLHGASKDSERAGDQSASRANDEDDHEEGPSDGRSRSAELEDVGSDDEEGDPFPLADGDNHTSDVPPNTETLPPSDEDHPPTWHDIALSIAASLMLKMRDEVKTRLGYTTSAVCASRSCVQKVESEPPGLFWTGYREK